MGLTCECGEDSYDWYFYPPEDYTKAPIGRRHRCCSCNELIGIGATCLRFKRYRWPRPGIEERIYGDGSEVPLGPYWMCEECGDLYWSLDELGYCVPIEENLHQLVEDYAAMQRERGR